MVLNIIYHTAIILTLLVNCDMFNFFLKGTGKVKSAHKTSGPHCWSLIILVSVA